MRDSPLVRIIERSGDLLIEAGMWTGALVLVVSMMCAAYALDSWLPVGIY